MIVTVVGTENIVTVMVVLKHERNVKLTVIRIKIRIKRMTRVVRVRTR